MNDSLLFKGLPLRGDSEPLISTWLVSSSFSLSLRRSFDVGSDASVVNRVSQIQVEMFFQLLNRHQVLHIFWKKAVLGHVVAKGGVCDAAVLSERPGYVFGVLDELLGVASLFLLAHGRQSRIHIEREDEVEFLHQIVEFSALIFVRQDEQFGQSVAPTVETFSIERLPLGQPVQQIEDLVKIQVILGEMSEAALFLNFTLGY